MQELGSNQFLLDKDDIYLFLKNRPPLLMINNAIVIPGISATSDIALQGDEWFFACHFPGNPLMPGVLQLETVFQTSALPLSMLEGYMKKNIYIAEVSKANFKESIKPGDKLKVYTEIKRFKRGIAEIAARICKDQVECFSSELNLVVEEDLIRPKR